MPVASHISTSEVDGKMLAFFSYLFVTVFSSSNYCLKSSVNNVSFKGSVQGIVSVTLLQVQAFILLGFFVILTCTIAVCKEVETDIIDKSKHKKEDVKMCSLSFLSPKVSKVDVWRNNVIAQGGNVDSLIGSFNKERFTELPRQRLHSEVHI